MVAVAALAQTASEKPSVDVRRVGARLQCQCGCKDSVATCSMLECHFSKPAKERIAQMQSVGMSDEQIVQAFIRDYGMAVYLAHAQRLRLDRSVCVGRPRAGRDLAVPPQVLQAARSMTDLGEIEADDPELAKYKDQIEKDTANLD